MKRLEIIEALKAKGVEFNPTAKKEELEALYNQHFGEIPNDGPQDPKPTNTGDSQLMDMMKSVVTSLDSLNKRIVKLEGPGGNEFKTNANSEDVERVAKDREGIDDRLVQIVDEVLGSDFGIKMETFPDRPGFLFTLVVPPRLSDVSPGTRPVIDPETGKYRVQADGKTLILEDYQPEDRRSRAIGSAQSFDAIREHCERVRSYIVSYYQKMQKPLPEFKLKK